MAKIKGPLHSLAAAGTLGRALQYAALHGKPYCRQPPRPPTSAVAVANRTPTPARANHRANIAAAVAAWHAADPAARQALAATVTDDTLPLYHRYIRAALRRPPTTTGTTWDDGATAWDDGTTTWDN